MLDNDLRRLERRAAASRSPADGAALLRAKLRAGTLQRQHVELAAHLGDANAALAVGLDVPNPKTWRHFRDWGAALSSFGAEGAFRAALADGEQWARVVKATPATSEHARVISSRLEALAAWLLLPTRATRRHVARLGRRELDLRPLDPDSLERAGLDAWRLTVACSQVLAVANALRAHVLSDAPIRVGEWWPSEVETEPTRLMARIRAAARNAVVPWALGERDPVADRGRSPLDRLEIATPCARSWESLEAVPGDARVRRCDDCRLNVYDLSALDKSEALELLRRHEGRRLCVRLHRRPDGRVLTRDCPASLRAMAERSRRPTVLGGIYW